MFAHALFMSLLAFETSAQLSSSSFAAFESSSFAAVGSSSGAFGFSSSSEFHFPSVSSSSFVPPSFSLPPGSASVLAPFPGPTETAVNVFLPNSFVYFGDGIVGSVVDVDSDCATTMAIGCFADPDASIAAFCNPSNANFYTYSSTSFGVSGEHTVNGKVTTLIDVCSIDNTKAVCTASYATADGSTSTTQGVLTGNVVQVPITAGGSKLAACTAGTKNAAAPTGIPEVYKVVIAQGAAAFLAAALL